MSKARALAWLLVLAQVTCGCGPATQQAPQLSREAPLQSPVSVEVRRGESPRDARVAPPWSEAVRAHVRETRASVMLGLDFTANGFQVFGEPASDLEEVFSFARAVKQERYEINGEALILDFMRIRYGNAIVYDGQQAFIELASEELEHRRSGGEGHMNALTAFGLRPLSLVGTLLSYEKSWACACAGGPPSSEVSWSSIDLSSWEPPRLVDLLEEESLVGALLEDRCVAPLLTSVAPRPDSLDEVASLLEEKLPVSEDCSGASEAFTSLALLGYDAERDLAGVRLGFPHAISPGHSKTSFLGLWVRPRPDFRAALQDAIEGRGFFLRDER